MALTALKRLWEVFRLDGAGPLPFARELRAEELPEPYRGLLVHYRHMTVTLEEHHHAPVRLRVLSRRRDGDLYARRLVLTVGGRRPAVLFGLMRIDLAATPAAAREEILAETTPLGAVLIAHKVLRRIEPLAYLEIEATPPLAKAMKIPPRTLLHGRLAVIHCSGRPAVELLEVVAP